MDSRNLLPQTDWYEQVLPVLLFIFSFHRLLPLKAAPVRASVTITEKPAIHSASSGSSGLPEVAAAASALLGATWCELRSAPQTAATCAGLEGAWEKLS